MNRTLIRRPVSVILSLASATLHGTQVCGDDTVVLIANELRSAFDEFLQLARGHFEVENVPVSEDDMVIDQDSNERPKPVALKRLRRCPPSREG